MVALSIPIAQVIESTGLQSDRRSRGQLVDLELVEQPQR
jgi:hypothetical protein